MNAGSCGCRRNCCKIFSPKLEGGEAEASSASASSLFSSRAEVEQLVAEHTHFDNLERIQLQNGLAPIEIRGKTEENIFVPSAGLFLPRSLSGDGSFAFCPSFTSFSCCNRFFTDGNCKNPFPPAGLLFACGQCCSSSGLTMSLGSVKKCLRM